MRLYLLYDTNNSLKSRVGREKVTTSSLYKQRCYYGRHYITLHFSKSVNH